MRCAAILMFFYIAFGAANHFVIAEPPSSKIGAAQRSETALMSLRKFLESSPEHRGALEQQDFATLSLRLLFSSLPLPSFVSYHCSFIHFALLRLLPSLNSSSYYYFALPCFILL